VDGVVLKIHISKGKKKDLFKRFILKFLPILKKFFTKFEQKQSLFIMVLLFSFRSLKLALS